MGDPDDSNDGCWIEQYAGLVILIVVILGFAFWSCSCATTTLYHDGIPVARFQGNMTKVHFEDEHIKWDADSVMHSTTTLAGGKSVSATIPVVGPIIDTLFTLFP